MFLVNRCVCVCVWVEGQRELLLHALEALTCLEPGGNLARMQVLIQ